MKKKILSFAAAALIAFSASANVAFAGIPAITGERPAATGERIDIASEKGTESYGRRHFGRDDNGRAPIHRAAQRGETSKVSHFLIAGENPDVKMNDGTTPLHFAKNEEITRLLIKHGAKVDPRDRKGRTPLHLAAEYKKEAIAKVLVDKGANIEAKDNNGWMPLHYAAKHGSAKVMRLLLERDANPYAKAISPVRRRPSEGPDPHAVAVRYHPADSPVVKLLEKWRHYWWWRGCYRAWTGFNLHRYICGNKPEGLPGNWPNSGG